MPLRLNGSTSGYSEIDAPAIAGDQVFTLPTTGGTLDRINRAGNILQVVSAEYGTAATIVSTTPVDTGATATITPSSATSKILVLVSMTADAAIKSSVTFQATMGLVRNSTLIANKVTTIGSAPATDTFSYGAVSADFAYLDSPATTSATNYKVTGKTSTTGSSCELRTAATNTGSRIILLEVAA